MAHRTRLQLEFLESRALLWGLTVSLTTDQPVYQVGQPVQIMFTSIWALARAGHHRDF